MKTRPLVVCTSHCSSVELGFPERTQCQLCSMLCSRHLESCLADREHDADSGGHYCEPRGVCVGGGCVALDGRLDEVLHALGENRHQH